MTDDIWTEQVTEQTIAAVRATVMLSNIANSFRDPLDKVWNFLRQQDGLHIHGLNTFIYRSDETKNASGGIQVDFGVQVTRPFASEGDVMCLTTPAGLAAATVHRGAYSRLGQTHAAVRAWCDANGHAPAGVNWEIYGNWNNDPARLETRVSYLLR